jgi:hypothetical protein
LEKKLAISPDGNGKSIFSKFELKFEKKWPYHQRETKKLKYATKFENFNLWNLK